jgi:nitric oxide reductase NorE protein
MKIGATSPALMHDSTKKSRRVPGEAGIWVFVLLDMLIFTEMFVIFVWSRSEHRDLFHASQEKVNPAFGLTYTLLLLASSWCVVMAVGAARRSMISVASNFARWGFLLGAGFAALKIVEYTGKFAAGITPLTNGFFMFYFVLTLVHLLHASVGLGVLAYMRNQIHALGQSLEDPSGPNRLRMIESSAVYWHMVDLLWIVLFALFYLEA